MFPGKIAPFVVCFVALMLLVGCGGGMSTPTGPGTPPNATARFALVANSISNSISTFAVDSQTGQLTSRNTVPTGGNGSGTIALGPAAHFAYVANANSNSIST